MSTHATPYRESLQAAARTVITMLAGVTDPQRFLRHSRLLDTAVKELEAMLTGPRSVAAGPEPDRRTA
ncbi:hypothetical protein RFN58_42095 [Streptomyces iakyrus]|uniref:hypothetical protein n=1 Tax=Streptomyces iakyrus TaxID=68219 RepID=UPI000526AFC5|nr:hypothetical protein [Streptomyces iakyrus]